MSVERKPALNGQQIKAAAEGSHITDPETGEVIEITQEIRDEALQVHGQIEGAFWQLATALARIKNEQLYLALGFDSFRGYCESTLPFGVRNAYHYALVGEKIGLRLLESGSSAKPVSHSLESIGIRKLKLIAEKAEDQINDLIREGRIKIGDELLSQDELADTSVKDLTKRLRAANDRLEKMDLLEEQKKAAEMERDYLKAENEEIKELEQEYREWSVKGKHIEDDLKEAENALYHFAKRFDRIDEQRVPAGLEIRLLALIDQISLLDTKFREKFIDLVMRERDIV